MQQSLWGPGAWVFLHCITFAYPEHPSFSDKQAHRDFFHQMKYVLPCESCRQHYKLQIEQALPIEPALENRDTLSRWCVELHNRVNMRLGKPTMSYEVAKHKYQTMRGICSMNTCESERRRYNFLLCLIIILLIVILILVASKFQCVKKIIFSAR